MRPWKHHSYGPFCKPRFHTAYEHITFKIRVEFAECHGYSPLFLILVLETRDVSFSPAIMNHVAGY